MHTPIKRFRMILILIPLLAGIAVGQDYVEDEDVDAPDVRVARISVLVGDSSIQRIDSDEWETVVENLPIVQGDQIQTERNSKVEIQLDRFNYLHLDGNSNLKIEYLADDGIAMSLSQGTLGVRLVQFDFKKGYLEVDAPSATVALRENGSYRIDAGDEFNKEVRVSVRDDGEARVYSRDSGFVVKDGRAARLFLDGNLEGEWELSRASTMFDGFDSWLQSRNESIARTLAGDDDDSRDYYDDDIYGADDLNDHGRWTYTSAYGHIWQPYASSTARYSNWTPYRYGHWRWLPYYGWTWVNDEPWGWATYHSGRWIFYQGNWYWSPHRRFRNRGRSWWRPALVFVTYIGNNYCWYPLPYGYGYYDYNRRFRKRWHQKRRSDRPDRREDDDRNPTRREPDRKRELAKAKPPLGRVPVGGVVSAPATGFGSARNGFGRPSLGLANRVLEQTPVLANSDPSVPDYRDLKGKLDRDIKAPVRKPRDFKPVTGATKRTSADPLDDKLMREKIYGNRKPVERRAGNDSGGLTKSPETGAVERKRDSKESPPIFGPGNTRDRPTKTRGESTKDRKPESPGKVNPTPPYVPRTKQPDRKSSPEPRRDSGEIRRTAPSRDNTKRSEPRRSPPVRNAPKKSSPEKRSPKPAKDSPKKGKPGPLT